MNQFDLHAAGSTHDEPLTERQLVLKTCPPPTPVFIGRQEIISQMHTYFSSDIGKRHIFVLYGLGGAGKSQIAYKFIDESQFGVNPSRYDMFNDFHTHIYSHFFKVL